MFAELAQQIMSMVSWLLCLQVLTLYQEKLLAIDSFDAFCQIAGKSQLLMAANWFHFYFSLSRA